MSSVESAVIEPRGSTHAQLAAASVAARPLEEDAASSVRRLAEALEAVRGRCPDLPVLAIRWMHLGHPLQDMQEAFLRRKGTATGPQPRAPLAILRRASQCVLYALYLSARLLALRWLLRRQLAALTRQPFDIIAKTWCLSVERPRDGRDFYYGDLQQRLAQRNVRMLLLCGDVSGRLRSAFARGQVAVSPLPRLPELCLVHPFAPIQMMGQQLATSWRLGRLRRREQDPLIRAILAHAGRECLAPDTALTGLLWWVGNAAARTWRPKAVVTFHEGRAWEPCVWQGVNTADPTCQTVGYQHTVLLPLNFALLRASEDGRAMARPDVVLCLGPRTQAMLRPSHGRSRLVVFGTFRHVPPRDAQQGPRPGRRTVLVVPETGILPEAKALFHFTMRAADRLPDHRFIFRCHPIMPFERVRPHLDRAPEACQNIEISEVASIIEDCARSSVILYRGSSSVLYAVLQGLKPVYVHDETLRDGDPLFELTEWRTDVSSVDELEQTLRAYASMSEGAAMEPWREAVEYVSAYTGSVDDASVDRLLEAVGLPGGRGIP